MKKINVASEKCIGCKSCSLACSLVNYGDHNLKRTGVTVWRNAFERFERPQICRHCDESPCVAACMTGAITRNLIDEPVIQNWDKCVGCNMCVMVCPYGAIQPLPKLEKVVKCSFCHEYSPPPCVQICPTQTLFVEG